jgi:hypothetical protein
MSARTFPLHLHSAYAETPSTGAMMRDRCMECGCRVDLTNESDYQPVRINGDSRYGYEPLCRACWPPEQTS